MSKTWKKGDVIAVNLPMEVRKVVADPHVADDIGKVALQRGPLIYCAEWADNNGMATNFILPENDAVFHRIQEGFTQWRDGHEKRGYCCGNRRYRP